LLQQATIAKKLADSGKAVKIDVLCPNRVDIDLFQCWCGMGDSYDSQEKKSEDAKSNDHQQ
jgi:hypothetical protein